MQECTFSPDLALNASLGTLGTLDDTLMHGASVNITGMHCLTWMLPTLGVAKQVDASLWHLGMPRVFWNPLWCTMPQGYTNMP